MAENTSMDDDVKQYVMRSDITTEKNDNNEPKEAAKSCIRKLLEI